MTSAGRCALPTMRLVTCQISVSLDGFVAGANQSRADPLGEGGMRLHEWAFATESWRRENGLEGGERKRGLRRHRPRLPGGWRARHGPADVRRRRRAVGRGMAGLVGGRAPRSTRPCSCSRTTRASRSCSRAARPSPSLPTASGPPSSGHGRRPDSMASPSPRRERRPAGARRGAARRARAPPRARRPRGGRAPARGRRRSPARARRGHRLTRGDAPQVPRRAKVTAVGRGRPAHDR